MVCVNQMVVFISSLRKSRDNMPEYMNNDEYQDEIYKYDSYKEARILRVRLQSKNKIEHRCEYCPRTILIGEGSAYHTGISDGQFYEYHVCDQCYEGEVN
jgi:hypothetical protein